MTPMASRRRPTMNPDAGDAPDSSLSTSAAPGLSDAHDARPLTGLEALAADLDLIFDQRARRGPRCVMGAVLEALPDDMRAKVDRLLTEPGPTGQYTSSALIADALTRAGYQVGANGVLRHRRTAIGAPGGCACV